MTINQYLCLLEVLQIRRDRSIEKYLRLLERANSPTAAHIDPDGLPKSKNYRNTHEELLIKVAEAAAAYEKAWNEYETFYTQFFKNLGKLDLYERRALERIYYYNMGKPPEKRRNGVCRDCSCRTKAEAAVLIKKAKDHLTEILRAQGVKIE